MDKSRSTTPPVPPPGFSESLQQHHSESSQPPGAQKEATDVDMDTNGPGSQPESATQSKLPRLARGKTPEQNRVIQISQHTNGQANSHSHAAAVAHAPHLARDSATPGSPGGTLASFDWDDLETRFEKALTDANEDEKALLEEFDELVKYFNVWASTASAHDNERAAKRYGAPQYVS